MKIESSSRSYDVNFLSVTEALRVQNQAAFVVTDRNLSLHYPELIEGMKVLVIDPGEGSKSLETYTTCVNWLASQSAKRNAILIAFGGGVVGDLAGFVAATYMRGIDLLMVPTSLLAMVDSSVGGKVAIDLEAGKNLVGSFWPPVEVRICPDFLKTLPEREFRSGLAEVIKTAAIMDFRLFERLAQGRDAIDNELVEVIETCVAHKSSVVQEDEFEALGRRAILNFGHTVGHAIETALGYGTWTHGEAVSVGMVVESRLGENLGFTQSGTTAKLQDVLSQHGLPTTLPESVEAQLLLQLMRTDKKATEEGLSFSLLTKIGECKLCMRIAEADVRQVLTHI